MWTYIGAGGLRRLAKRTPVDGYGLLVEIYGSGVWVFESPRARAKAVVVPPGERRSKCRPDDHLVKGSLQVPGWRGSLSLDLERSMGDASKAAFD